MSWKWIAIGIALIGLALGLVVGLLSGKPSPVPAAENDPNLGFFEISQSVVATGERLFSFRFSTVVTPDVEAREDGQRGNYRWSFGDRNAYHTAYVMLLHEDPGFHPFIQGVRISIQVMREGLQTNDRNGKEIDVRSPYTYVKGFPLAPLLYDFPNPTIALNHDRPQFTSAGGCRNCSKITDFSPAGFDIIKNPKVKWYAQGSQIIVGVHDTLGPFVRLIISGVLQAQLPYAAYFAVESGF